jgi:predicted nucleotidyltransferase
MDGNTMPGKRGAKKHRQAWEKFGIARLALFGAFARDQANEHRYFLVQ